MLHGVGVGRVVDSEVVGSVSKEGGLVKKNETIRRLIAYYPSLAVM